MKCQNNCQFCNFNKYSYDESCENLDASLHELYSRQARLIKPFVKADEPNYYRHKVTGSFRKHKGKIVVGVYEENSHKLINSNGCFLENQKANAIIQTIRKLANDFKLQVFNEDTGYGLLRHVQVRTAYHTNEILVTLVLGEKIFKSRHTFIKELLKVHPDITSVVCNYNMRQTSVILGDEEQVVYGPGFIYDYIDGVKFTISSKSFYQINPAQVEKLYSKALEIAKITKNDTVLDTYCGIGTITLLATRFAKDVIGVEINEQAIKDANKNARINKINNVKFIKNDASYFMNTYKGKVDVLIMDPPRAGSNDLFLNAVLKLKPRKIVYISCNPITQRRDVNKLSKSYKISYIQGYDLFPYTNHLESLMLLERI